LNRSKNLWLRLDDRHRGVVFQTSFFHRGKQILYRGYLNQYLATGPAGIGKVAILWGQHVCNGWDRGPDGNNADLHLWSLWSFFQSACFHTEFFSMMYRLSSPDQ
jgi:hypothetical protein